MTGFIIWAAVGILIIVLGVCAFFAKKPVGFWANVETVKVSDVEKYNHATGKLFIVYGVVFILLGLPILVGQNSPLIILSGVGVMFETIIVMSIYSVLIANKYEVKNNAKK